MDINARIAQFENMCQSDPENEMAHFSLAGAYAQAGRFADAAASYLRCADIVPGMSKAYQLAAESLVKAGNKDRAAEVAIRGYTIATEKGDRMPASALAEVLKSLGKQVPEVAGKTAKPVSLPLGGGPTGPIPPGSFVCRRTGRPGTKMSRPPFKGPVGAWIGENIAKETWETWIGQGTKVINELRLDLSREQDAETYDQHMREYLGIDEALLEEIQSKAPSR
ncbi:MAG: Fe(2+)-trafficking protein [Phycisphaeraceae bacterium]|nr:Fe(2+)-trafficking protein [Phycisphaeraceae bacterium]